MRRGRPSGIIRVVWEELSEPWRVCAKEAWEAYGRGSLPIGAVVTDSRGKVVSRGRNRIHERSGPPGAVFDHKLAHAELNALLSLDHRGNDPHACVLWTTTEPCPLCAGAARMADIGGLRYAAREPWAGSVAMFLGLKPSVLERFLRLYGEALPAATQAGRRLHRSGALRTMSDEQIPVSEVLARVREEITSST